MTAKAVSGDIVVSSFTDGYIVGRVRARHDEFAPGWEFIRSEPERAAAVKFAEQIAERARVCVWVCDDEVQFRQMPWKGPMR